MVKVVRLAWAALPPNCESSGTFATPASTDGSDN